MDEIEVVAADFIVRLRGSGDIESGNRGRLLGQERQLDLARDRQFLLDSALLEQLPREASPLDRDRRL